MVIPILCIMITGVVSAFGGAMAMRARCKADTSMIDSLLRERAERVETHGKLFAQLLERESSIAKALIALGVTGEKERD